ncbi:Serine/threonine-protein kinase RAD53 [Tolypocladium paradoxum]|uniref:Serine/threonine-protein kinase RAD53 n=1 Tax=Tolypocladium paradoxum TaxID=94208 RepID=A0A2S4L394_9HYPO|nr:Serine/threonine-protein kinase RAD53 [Tolypocladium paradoxum]
MHPSNLIERIPMSPQKSKQRFDPSYFRPRGPAGCRDAVPTIKRPYIRSVEVEQAEQTFTQNTSAATSGDDTNIRAIMSYRHDDDSNLIAFLTGPLVVSTHCLAEQTIALPANRARRVVPGTAPGTPGRALVNPYGTPPRESEHLLSEDRPRLELRFDTPPKSGQAFILGTAADCDIVLPREESPGQPARGLSRHHCAISFDSRGYLVLRDLSSNQTTAVIIEGTEREKRRDGTWIIGGHETTIGLTVMVQLHPRMRFVIWSPNWPSGAYAENIRLFKQSRSRVHA